MPDGFVVNTAENEVKSGAVIEGFIPAGGTLLDLDIGAGFIDGREVLGDAALAVAVADAADWSGYLVTEDGAGTLAVVQSPNTDHATGALALAEAKLIAVPAGAVAIMVGVNDDTTAVGNTKESSVKAQVADVSADN